MRTKATFDIAVVVIICKKNENKITLSFSAHEKKYQVLIQRREKVNPDVPLYRVTTEGSEERDGKLVLSRWHDSMIQGVKKRTD